jgi:ABC-type nitrate/sulfonate/bicarbonate transport system ATPase subunit
MSHNAPNRVPGTVAAAPQPAGLASALHIDELTVHYGDSATSQAVIDQLNLTVEAGEFVSIIGPSGSGKSTLLHAIGGLVPASSGEILISGEESTGQKGLVSYMPQQPALLPWRTIEKNVLLGREIANGVGAADLAEARDWLARIGLGDYARNYPDVLSGGMQQRVAFLRALLSPQELICLDEPFSALDALTRTTMQRWLLEIWQQTRRSILLVTHNIEEALLLSDTVYVLSARPARVIDRIEVPFSRPRHEHVVDEPQFVGLRRQISDLLEPPKVHSE